MGIPNRDNLGKIRRISSLSPLLESSTTESPGTTIPKSPCRASAGCMNKLGEPVETKVEDIFWATRPDLPMPESTILPLWLETESTQADTLPDCQWTSSQRSAPMAARRTPLPCPMSDVDPAPGPVKELVSCSKAVAPKKAPGGFEPCYQPFPGLLADAPNRNILETRSCQGYSK